MKPRHRQLNNSRYAATSKLAWLTTSALLGCSSVTDEQVQQRPLPTPGQREATAEARYAMVPVHAAPAAPVAPGWQALANAPPGFLDNCNLLTDGSAMCHEYNTNHWHRLSPDINGSYANGAWDSPPIADMPNGNDPSFGCAGCAYAPLYFASAVLADGRVVVIGGEYVNLVPVWTNIGFIYDPVANSWSSQLNEAFGGGNVGDAMASVLADGTFVLSEIGTANLESLNAATLTFTALNPTGKLDVNNEENWNILYDGTLLTVDSRVVASFERYNPVTNTWGNSGSTGVNMADTGGAPVGDSKEVGPCVLRPDKRLICFSGNALGQNALYDTASNTWTNNAAMDFPLVPAQTYHYAMADAPASLLPNGNVLAMASPVTPTNPFNAGSHFYEFAYVGNALTAVADSPNAASFVSYQGRMLLLPTGEVLLTAYDQGGIQDVMLYSNGGAPQNAWRPAITSAPALVAGGSTYPISGRLFNGFSEGASYGDDAQASTNYPLVRITNNASGHVVYARTHGHSRMGVEPVGSVEVVTTNFDVPVGLEPGPSTLVVVVNGIPSVPMAINDNNRPPVAECRDLSANGCTLNDQSVDNGSYDPDGNLVGCSANPPPPYGVGTTLVTLTCTDALGLTDSCTAQVTVTDNVAPVFTFVPPALNITVCTNVNLGQATATDNCGGPVTITNNAPTKFPLGTTIVTWTAKDASGNTTTATQTVTATLGDDPSCCPAGTHIILGNNNSNVLVGTTGKDCILLRGGNDVVNSFGGGDYVSGGAGSDTITTGFGNDYVNGGAGVDTCAAAPGSDTVIGCEVTF